MATKGMLQTVHTIKCTELEQLADAYDNSKTWWKKNNNKIKAKQPIFVELQGSKIKQLLSQMQGRMYE